eukprot:CAMPEP_0179002946 /NCGR_PEP_ID=MMETSP0795-20121207/12364_1 /TAXON_ID=88552 /ORGANISM="Amoebophrya sp., Strain Ameob2" /LENGTH=1126 /DNA_ID=CAMNT_0020696819 /DNA_START=557 /DNA_END=3938 /DNA_ORIENTATION=-
MSRALSSTSDEEPFSDNNSGGAATPSTASSPTGLFSLCKTKMISESDGPPFVDGGDAATSPPDAHVPRAVERVVVLLEEGAVPACPGGTQNIAKTIPILLRAAGQKEKADHEDEDRSDGGEYVEDESEYEYVLRRRMRTRTQRGGGASQPPPVQVDTSTSNTEAIAKLNTLLLLVVLLQTLILTVLVLVLVLQRPAAGEPTAATLVDNSVSSAGEGSLEKMLSRAVQKEELRGRVGGGEEERERKNTTSYGPQHVPQPQGRGKGSPGSVTMLHFHHSVVPTEEPAVYESQPQHLRRVPSTAYADAGASTSFGFRYAGDDTPYFPTKIGRRGYRGPRVKRRPSRLRVGRVKRLVHKQVARCQGAQFGDREQEDELRRQDRNATSLLDEDQRPDPTTSRSTTSSECYNASLHLANYNRFLASRMRQEVGTNEIHPRIKHAEIPRVIHQTWSSAEKIPKKFAPFIRKFKDLEDKDHGEYRFRYVFWDDARLEALAKKYLRPKYYERVWSKTSAIAKADIGRLLFLYVHGGIYADLDVDLVPAPEAAPGPAKVDAGGVLTSGSHSEVKRSSTSNATSSSTNLYLKNVETLLQSAENANFTILLGEEHVSHVVLLEKRSVPLVSNAVMIGSRRHEFWRWCLEKMLKEMLMEIEDRENEHPAEDLFSPSVDSPSSESPAFEDDELSSPRSAHPHEAPEDTYRVDAAAHHDQYYYGEDHEDEPVPGNEQVSGQEKIIDPVTFTGPRRLDRLVNEWYSAKNEQNLNLRHDDDILRLPFWYFSPKIAEWNLRNMQRPAGGGRGAWPLPEGFARGNKSTSFGFGLRSGGVATVVEVTHVNEDVGRIVQQARDPKIAQYNDEATRGLEVPVDQKEDSALRAKRFLLEAQQRASGSRGHNYDGLPPRKIRALGSSVRTSERGNSPTKPSIIYTTQEAAAHEGRGVKNEEEPLAADEASLYQLVQSAKVRGVQRQTGAPSARPSVVAPRSTVYESSFSFMDSIKAALTGSSSTMGDGNDQVGAPASSFSVSASSTYSGPARIRNEKHDYPPWRAGMENAKKQVEKEKAMATVFGDATSDWLASQNNRNGGEVIDAACTLLDVPVEEIAALGQSYFIHNWQCSWCREDDALNDKIALDQI